MKLGILTDFYEHFKLYEKSCIELNVDYVIIDFLSSDWLENIKKNLDCDGFLVRPSHDFQEHNDVYMERLYFLNFDLHKPIYPSYNELRIYENKRNMATWLELNKFPYAKTKVFLKKNEAKEYLKKTSYPVVFKANIGSGSNGVRIIKNKHNALNAVNKIFGRFTPLLSFGLPEKRLKFGLNIPIPGNTQKHVLLVQEFYKIKWEWRIIKIDNNFFGHQKLLKGEFASGSDMVGWVKPPLELLELTRKICDAGNFYSMAIDIFETEDGKYIVNELQSLFGSFLDYQMKIDDVKGRYIYQHNTYHFEEGEFNQHSSYLLRVKHFIKILNN